MRGFVRKELPLVCQKCNPAMTCRDPALRGKLLRQKCVSVGAPSCLASLSISISLFFPLYIHLTLCFFPPSPYFIAPSLLFTPHAHLIYPHRLFHLAANFMHSSLHINTSETPPSSSSPILPLSSLLKKRGFAKCRQI